MTPMMKLINALNAVIVALTELSETGSKEEIAAFEKIVDVSEQNAKEPEKAESQKSEQAVTFDEIKKAFVEKSRMGYKADVKAILQKYGAEKLSAIQEKDYADVLREAEQIGK